MSNNFVETDDGSATLVLEGKCTVENAGALRKILHDALTRAQVLELDMKDVETVDITFLQLLVAAHKTAASLGRTLKVTGEPSPSVVQLIEDVGADLPFEVFVPQQMEG
jgi:anti-anti-sigma regulatory factor